MWGLYVKDPEHWIPISTIASFKRMRAAFPDSTTEWIAGALRTLSTELEVSEDGKDVRRKTEVKEPKDGFERSVYAKGFGKEEPDTQTKLEAFFGGYGKTAAVRMRRMDPGKEFKVSYYLSHLGD